MSTEKQINEEKILNLFLNLLAVEAVSVLKNESPDFDLVINNTKIGIELTDYTLSTSLSNKTLSVLSTMSSIKREVERIINTQYNRKILINYTLRTPILHIIKRKEKQKLIDFFANLVNQPVVKNTPANTSFRQIMKFSVDENKFIKEINISSFDHHNQSRVTDNAIYTWGVIPFQSLNKIVQNKNSKMDFNRNQENWLVIYIPQKQHSGGIVSDDVLNYKLNSHSFSRIFLIEDFITPKISEMVL